MTELLSRDCITLFNFLKLNIDIPICLKSSGSDQNLQMGQLRRFQKSINCDEPVLEAGNDYLIVGKSGMPVRNDRGEVIE